MIKIALKHYLFDIGLSVFFDNLSQSFAKRTTYKYSTNPTKLRELYPIGTMVNADLELSVFGVLPDHTAKLYFPNHPCRITGYTPQYNCLYCYAYGIYTHEYVILYYNDDTNRWCSNVGTSVDHGEITEYVRNLACKNQKPVFYD